MEGSMEDIRAPKSWEIVDLDESMSHLLLKKDSSKPPPQELCDGLTSTSASCNSSSSSSLNSSASNLAGGDGCGSEKVSKDLVNQVDQYLCEAIQNPRERHSGFFFIIYNFCSCYSCLRHTQISIHKIFSFYFCFLFS